MDRLELKKIIEDNYYLKRIAKNDIILSKEESDLLENSKKININNQTFPIDLFINILEDDYYNEYVNKFFNNDIKSLTIYTIFGKGAKEIYKFSKSNIIKGIKKIVDNNIHVLTNKQKENYHYLKNLVSYEKFLSIYKNGIYKIDIENNNYSINISDILEFMNLNSKEFVNICYLKDIETLYNIKKEYFIYAAFKFFINTNALENFILPKNILNNIIDIYQSNHIDLEAINRYLETKDTIYKKVNIDASLKEYLLKDMPNNFNTLEKAIYVYIRMCKTLTYNEEYFAVNQATAVTQKYKNIDYISKINLNNNEVVCYQFSAIYSKLLNELGINFRTYYHNMQEENYGSGHPYLEFRVDNYLVNADSIIYILKGDLVLAKLNRPLNGIKCINKSKYTQNLFNETLNKVYSLIVKEENSLIKENFEDLLEEYSHITKNIKDISIFEKLNILVKKVNSKKLSGIDAYSYALKLRKILFTKEEMENKININIVRNNEPNKKDVIASTITIISVNEDNFNNDDTLYYYFYPNNELMYVSKEELEFNFKHNVLDYIKYNDKKIPGLFKEVLYDK